VTIAPSTLRPSLNIARDVVIPALRNHVCQGEQESADAVADSWRCNTRMLQNWAFTGERLAGIVTSEITGLFRSVADQVLDAYSLESPDTLNPLTTPAMASEHPDAPKQFGIRLSQETKQLVSAIQQRRCHRRR
jgi:hypothetical protein